MAPSPLLKMDLYLSGKEILYVPPKYEIEDTFTTVLEEIVIIMATVPRLYEKFSLPQGGLKKFYEAIVMDQDCNKLQKFIDDGTPIPIHSYIKSFSFNCLFSLGQKKKTVERF